MAYVVGAGGQSRRWGVDERDRLGKRLPDYMVPQYFVAVERLPLNAERQGRPQGAAGAGLGRGEAGRAFEAPQGRRRRRRGGGVLERGARSGNALGCATISSNWAGIRCWPCGSWYRWGCASTGRSACGGCSSIRPLPGLAEALVAASGPGGGEDPIVPANLIRASAPLSRPQDAAGRTRASRHRPDHRHGSRRSGERTGHRTACDASGRYPRPSPAGPGRRYLPPP